MHSRKRRGTSLDNYHICMQPDILRKDDKKGNTIIHKSKRRCLDRKNTRIDVSDSAHKEILIQKASVSEGAIDGLKRAVHEIGGNGKDKAGKSKNKKHRKLTANNLLTTHQKKTVTDAYYYYRKC
jgi:hypothetical protein